MRITFYLASIIILCAIVGCVTPCPKGRDFRKEPIKNMIIGQTNQTEVANLFGVPYQTKKVSLDGTIYDTFTYFYAYPESEENIYVYRWRNLNCTFKNGILDGYFFNSVINEDQVKFKDIKKVNIEKGKTTKSDVQNLLGIPTSKTLLPSICLTLNTSSDTKEVWSYAYNSLKPSSEGIWKEYFVYDNSISMYFDSNGILIDYKCFETVDNGK